MTHEALNPNQDWIVELCRYHQMKFKADYVNFISIQQALTSKLSCIKCNLDMPEDIVRPE